MIDIIKILSDIPPNFIAVVVLLIVLFGIYSIVDKHLGPFLKDCSKNIKDGFTNITLELKEDRKLMKETIIDITKKQTEHDIILKEIRENINYIILSDSIDE